VAEHGLGRRHLSRGRCGEEQQQRGQQGRTCRPGSRRSGCGLHSVQLLGS
jgi:hypothetical protein